MTKYVDRFLLPNKDTEEKLIKERMAYNGGDFGYIDNIYPCGIFTEKELSELDFENITILYGGNGSGKSTLLNLIANKLEVKRIAPFNSSEIFDAYVNECKICMAEDDEGYEYKCVPHNSRIISSDDIFDYMILARENNRQIADNVEELRNEYKQLKYGDNIRLTGLDNYEEFNKQILARNKSKRKYLYKMAGEQVKLNSNGETAVEYFEKKLQGGCLYCLDEPENSLSPKFQRQLTDLIQEKAKYDDCQFIIATHSPFVLAINGAKIYDLDESPVDIKKWWQLENVLEYFNFFEDNRHLFLD